MMTYQRFSVHVSDLQPEMISSLKITFRHSFLINLPLHTSSTTARVMTPTLFAVVMPLASSNFQMVQQRFLQLQEPHGAGKERTSVKAKT
jgi:hypothetical protein